MACVNGDGTLTDSAKNMLSAVDGEAKTAEELSKDAGAPLFKVRSSLRDMKSMGLVSVDEEDRYSLSEGGRKMLNR
ncbi:hypothetical protein [Salisediminibacterium selenitireducens]|uniref:Transcriptional regulator n=1 Tax=Bacillus selenitireducens (strain ATCC 700615 / DSM 15326 / MLS10) TaxID=439292 RepID=D6XYU7_BACIE|nr:hypothetical protein [Salisediminibacterium selenitireducens]ADH98255.1 hypothetical protein Bsel_0722 [[Bacillus] selenitireducens MLS10]